MSGAPENLDPKADATEEGGSSAGWRRWLPWVLIVLAAIIALVASLNVWVKRQALDTDAWTDSSSELLANDEIRNALAVYLVDQLYDNVDVGQALEERLPPSAQALGPPLAVALEPALVRTADTILARPRVQELWERSNRRAHQLLMALLEGEREILVATDGNVVLDLRPILDEIQERTGLGERLQERLPEDAGQLVIMEGNQLENARRAVNAIEVLSYFLSFVVLVLFAVAVYLAEGRRRTMLLAAGLSLLVVGLIVLVVRRLAGKYLVDALTSTDTAKEPVTAAWAIGTELLRNVGFNLLVYGLLIVFAAWVAGPSRPAVWLRRSLAPTMRERPLLVYGFVALVLLVVLLTGPTDGQRIYPLLFLFALTFVGTEVLRRQTAREFPATGTPP